MDSNISDPRVDQRIYQVRFGALVIDATEMNNHSLRLAGWEPGDIEMLISQVFSVEGLLEAKAGFPIRFSRIGFVDDPTDTSPAFYIVRINSSIFRSSQIVFNLTNSMNITPRRYGGDYPAFARYMVAHEIGHHLAATHPEMIESPPFPYDKFPADWRASIEYNAKEIVADKIAHILIGAEAAAQGFLRLAEDSLEMIKQNLERQGKYPGNPELIV